MSLPFKQDDIYLGLAQITGLLHILEDSLEIEYKVKDVTLGLMDSSVKTCTIPLRIIDTIDVEKKWFSVKFEITFTRLPALDNPFQLNENRLTLSVKKNDLERAHAFRSKLMHKILEMQLDEMEEDTETDSEIYSKIKREKKKEQREQVTNNQPRTRRDTGGLENMLRDE